MFLNVLNVEMDKQKQCLSPIACILTTGLHSTKQDHGGQPPTSEQTMLVKQLHHICLTWKQHDLMVHQLDQHYQEDQEVVKQ